jgi:hypothetical protein
MSTDELDLAALDDQSVIRLWGSAMRELRRRELIRSSNNPVADLAERAAAEHLNLTLQTKSNPGYDAVDEAGQRYEIKSRRVTAVNRSRQLGQLRNLEQRPFDFLVAVIYDEDVQLTELWKIPVDHVLACSTYRPRVNAHVAHAKGALLHPPAERIV